MQEFGCALEWLKAFWTLADRVRRNFLIACRHETRELSLSLPASRRASPADNIRNMKYSQTVGCHRHRPGFPPVLSILYVPPYDFGKSSVGGGKCVDQLCDRGEASHILRRRPRYLSSISLDVLHLVRSLPPATPPATRLAAKCPANPCCRCC